MRKDIAHHFVILIPFRNVKNYINDCIESILKQRYNNYGVVLLDDNSTDGTTDSIVFQNENINIIKNSIRVGPTANMFNALKQLEIDDDSIIVWVDGDDSLNGEYVLQMLNYFYNDGALLTYGQYIDTYGKVGLCNKYSESEVQNIRQVPWKASHLKTFKKSLFTEFLKLDPHGGSLKDDKGDFFSASSDMAIMFPLIEIAGYKRIQFIPNILYNYRLSPNNDHNSIEGRNQQLICEKNIRKKSKITFNKKFYTI